MQRSYLIQRLRKPLGGDKMARAIEAFSFGGGYANGGLSKDAMAILREVFSFDYMGAAEFEFGAVPQALNAITQARADLKAFTVSIPFADIAEPRSRDKKWTRPQGSAVVYVLCRAADFGEIETTIRQLAKDESKFCLKERVRLSSALMPIEDYHRETCGWLELDNGFFFFTDAAMFANVARLFGVETGDARMDAERDEARS